MVIFSLWKPSDGGRSFAKVETLLAQHGIACCKTGEVSPWHGRYEIVVADEDALALEAERVLFTHVEAFRVQALAGIHDKTQ